MCVLSNWKNCDIDWSKGNIKQNIFEEEEVINLENYGWELGNDMDMSIRLLHRWN